MSRFATGEEIICIDVSNGAEGWLRKGKTYIVLGQGQFCACCVDVGVGAYCFQDRFRRPIIEYEVIKNTERAPP